MTTYTIENAQPTPSAAAGSIDQELMQAVNSAYSRHKEGQPDSAVLLRGIPSEKDAKSLLYQCRRYAASQGLGLLHHKSDFYQDKTTGTWTVKFEVRVKRGTATDGSAGDDAASA
jgi:hypothetical protein